ncbi:glycerophosphodiester phosphodiesterase family protein [Echinicola jeungdonensis]|uniref:Glycerophosphodiester phosphodiesterase n=1 Tax=Echinicola jeungdonensis TaxID=709343 RepID=A0ABV5J3E1_9BACT|nr:glycerophosphodiester phosphodiesterase family protein [Echinicola jeungdonensis]MDN3670673.1 glycerophosphodiester phosphodiesterase family protein [Echinicola jeungdonensis]
MSPLSKVLAAFLLFFMTLSCTPQKETFLQNKVIAHRGAWKSQELPQNSLASLNRAIELGCEGTEFDVWMTKDEVLVVNHDADFYGMPIETTSYASLLTQKLSNGEHLPTLEEYLKEGMDQTKTKLILEIKPSEISQERSVKIAQKSVDLVWSLKAENWVDYITFDYEAGKKVIEMDPNARVSYLNGDKSPAELKEDGFLGLDYHYKVLKENPQWIQEARELGLTINSWTVNNREDMLWLLEEGTDFITTDEPEMLLEIVSGKTSEEVVD